ncbi:MAG: GumC family protein, partial [Bradymonadaceae bacterium]
MQAQSPPPAEEPVTVGEFLMHYWRLIRQYYWVVLLAVVVCTSAAYFITQFQTKKFTATSKIVFHKGGGDVMGRNIQQVDLLDAGGRWEFKQFWKTQKQVFETRKFARRVVEWGNLLNHEGFVPDTTESGKSLDRDARMERAVSKVLASTEVKREEESRVGTIRVETEDAELSAKIANGMAEEYIKYTDKFQSKGLREISNFFDSFVDKKRRDLEAAQKKLQEFKQKNNILSVSYEKQESTIAQNKQSINTELNKVRNKLSSQRALLDQIEELQKSNQEQRAIADLVENESLKAAYAKEAELEAKLAELKTKYLDKHPKVQAVANKLETVRENIDEEIKRIEDAVQNRVSLLKKKETNLEADLQKVRNKLFELDKLGQEYAQLKNREKNLQDLYDTVLKRSSELNMNSSFNSNDIETLEEAQVPSSPSSPSLPMNLSLGFLLGLAFGAG